MMKPRGHRSDGDGALVTATPQSVLPPPDPTTRVEVVLLSALPSPLPTRRSTAELITHVGLGGLLVAGAVTLPHDFDRSWAWFGAICAGAVLVLLGSALLANVPRSADSLSEPLVLSPAAVDDPPIANDVPSLTGQIGVVLVELRQLYGVAYRSHTWVADILPAYGIELVEPTLARNLLAVAALDAAGIRAEVTNLAATHSRETILATDQSLLAALHRVRDARVGPYGPAALLQSDPSGWPASMC